VKVTAKNVSNTSTAVLAAKGKNYTTIITATKVVNSTYANHTLTHNNTANLTANHTLNISVGNHTLNLTLSNTSNVTVNRVPNNGSTNGTAAGNFTAGAAKANVTVNSGHFQRIRNSHLSVFRQH
jgi:hypothetical protein